MDFVRRLTLIALCSLWSAAVFAQGSPPTGGQYYSKEQAQAVCRARADWMKGQYPHINPYCEWSDTNTSYPMYRGWYQCLYPGTSQTNTCSNIYGVFDSCALPAGTQTGEGITRDQSVLGTKGCDDDSYCEVEFSGTDEATCFDGVCFEAVNMVTTGAACGAGGDDPTSDEECTEIGMGASVCVKSPDETCVKTRAGNTYCWKPGDPSGCQYGSTDAACKHPSRATPPDDWKPETTTTTTTHSGPGAGSGGGTTTNITTITTYTENNYNEDDDDDDDDDGTPNDDEDDDGDGLGNGDDEDDDGDGIPDITDPDSPSDPPGDDGSNTGIANTRGCAAFTCIPEGVEGGAIACANARVNWEHMCQVKNEARATGSVGCDVPPICQHPDPVQCALLEETWRNRCRESGESSVGTADCNSVPPCESGDPVLCAILASQHAEGCKLKLDVAGDGGCQNPPVCATNDSILCAQLLESWRNRCALNATAGDGSCNVTPQCDTTRVECQQVLLQHKLTCGEGEGETWDEVFSDMGEGGLGDEWPEQEDIAEDDGADGWAEVMGVQGWGGGQCPEIPSISIMGGTTLDFGANGAFCDFLTLLKAMVLAAATFISGRILLGSKQ